MKKEYMKPMMANGLAMECSKLLMSSLKGDGVQMDISNDGASTAAEGRQGSFWDETE